MKSLWTEQFRPNTLDEYVWVDPSMRDIVSRWLADGALPHVLFSGRPGTGKTSLGKLLLKELKIPLADILTINASRERQIDAFQDRIVNFVDSWAMGPSGLKYIVLEEADKMGHVAQGLLRSEIETYSDSCRWLLTCNEPSKIIEALHSRLQHLHFPNLDHDAFILRLADVLDSEHIVYNEATLLSYVNATYPDLRRCLNLAQMNVQDSVLSPFRKQDDNLSDHLTAMVELFRQNKFIEARKLIIARIRQDEYEDFFRTLYRNVALFGATQDQQDEALLVIRNGLLNHATIADAEINASATLVELTRLNKS